MRRTVSEKLGAAALLAIVLCAALIGLFSVRPAFRTALSAWRAVEPRIVENVFAQSAGDTARSDEQKSKSEGGKARDKGVSIRIDESGIRIEAPSEDAEDDTTARRIIIGSGTARHGRYSETGSDIVRFRESIVVEADELVRGDVVAIGGDVTVKGKVVGDVVVLMGNARVLSGAEVNGDMVVIGGLLEEDPEVIIRGERVVLRNIAISMGGFPFSLGSHFRFFELFLIPVKFFIGLVLCFLVVLFLRGRVVRSHEHIASGVLKSFGTGFLVAFIGTFIVVLLTVILTITLIGIPLAVMLVVSCVAVYFIANTAFVYTLGSKVNEKLNIQTTNPFAIVLVGLAVLYLPTLIAFGFSLMPFGGFLATLFKILGGAFRVFAFLTGLGALFLSRFGARPAPAPAVGAVPVPPAQGA